MTTAKRCNFHCRLQFSVYFWQDVAPILCVIKMEKQSECILNKIYLIIIVCGGPLFETSWFAFAKEFRQTYIQPYIFIKHPELASTEITTKHTRENLTTHGQSLHWIKKGPNSFFFWKRAIKSFFVLTTMHDAVE